MTRSRPSFRPRPIENGRPLPIIRSNRDLKNEDSVIAHRGLPEIQTGVEEHELEEIHLREALLASMNMQSGSGDGKDGESGRKTLEIPIPVFREATHEERLKLMPWRPAKAAEYLPAVSDEKLRAIVLYEADHVDETWLTKYNSNDEKDPISVATLEDVFDRLEREQANSTEIGKYSVYSSSQRSFSCGEETKRALFGHWSSRRRKNNRSFLREFQPTVDIHNLDPSVAFRPRELENAANRSRARSNTIETFRKMVRMRTDMEKLREVVELMAVREACKKELMDGRLTVLRKRIAKNLLAPKQSIPQEGKKKKNSIPPKQGVAPVPETKQSIAEKQKKAGLDQFFYDEAGQKFLKQMRYFAGGFAGNGVNPYDHRVFSAASERNTIREHPREPKTVNFPEEVKFASGGKFGKNVRACGRVGRGGRVIFDRVVFEHERDRKFKVASYPASVAAGGCYSGGLPFHRIANSPLLSEDCQYLFREVDALEYPGDTEPKEPVDVVEHWPRRKKARLE